MKRYQGGFAVELVMELIAAVAVAIFIGTWIHLYNARHEKIGEDRAKAALQPKIDACAVDLNTARANVKQREADYELLRTASEKASAALRSAAALDAQAIASKDAQLAALAAHQRTQATAIQALVAVVAGPKAPTREAACDGAAKILHDYVAAELGETK